MFIKLNSSIIFLLLSLFVSAQSNKVLLTINDKKISKEEFVNSLKENVDSKWITNRDSVKKYLDSFIEFKLKVFEAESIGEDNTTKFRNEVGAFSNDLLKRYLVDNQTMDFFFKQTIERAKTEIRIRQILIRLDPNATPNDSLHAYQKAINIKKKLLNGDNFAQIASQISDDPTAATNGGDLWYVKPTTIPLAVENYIYSNPVYKISDPIRSKLGYHIIEILDKRPNQGRMKVAHIMLPYSKCGKDSAESVKKRADSIYQIAVQGTDFGILAQKYSQDKGTSSLKGELPWFETGKMPHEFEEAAYALKTDGDISKPVKTNYGWHIIKRISHEEAPSVEEIKEQIYNLVLNSEKGKIAEKKQIEKLKKEYEFKDFNTLSPFYSFVDSTIFDANWKIPLNTDLNGVLFSFSNKEFLQKDFAEFLETNQNTMYPIPIINYIYSKYDEFINKSILEFEIKNIESKNAEFASKLNYFKEEFLVNSIMQRDIWGKAENDSIGLLEFYKKNKNLYNKLLIADVCIYSYSVDKANKIEKQFNKIKDSKLSGTDLEKNIQVNVDKAFILSRCIKSEEGKDKMIDRCIELFKSGKLKKDQELIFFEDEKLMIRLNNEIKITDKPLGAIKSNVISDYQNYLENKWLTDLKKKNSVVINQDVFESIFSN
jgi:peptidyl-prolyl cis-trans isomerase SurA